MNAHWAAYAGVFIGAALTFIGLFTDQLAVGWLGLILCLTCACACTYLTEEEKDG